MKYIFRLTSLMAGLGLLFLSACAHHNLHPQAAVPLDSSRPTVASIYYYMSASLLHYEGDFLSAAELYRRAQEQDPNSTQIKKQLLISIANTYLYSQEPAEPVLQIFDNSRNFVATDLELLNAAYAVYNEAEKPEGIAWCVNTMVERYPSAKAYLQKFLWDYQLTSSPKESYLKKAYKLAGTKSDELITVAKIYTLADPKRSISILKEIRDRGASPEANSLLAEYSLRYGYYKDARELYDSFAYPADRAQMLAFLQQANKSRAFTPVLELETPILATQDAELMAELAFPAYLESDYSALNRIFYALERKYPEPVADAKIAVFLTAAALDSTAMTSPDKYPGYLFGARDADDILLFRTLKLSLGSPMDTASILRNWEADISRNLPQSAWTAYLLAATKATTNADSLLTATRIALCEELCDGVKGYDSDYSYLLSHYHASANPERKYPLLYNALKRYPHSPLFLNDLGYSLLEYPDSLETAGKLILQAVELEPDNAFYQDSIAWFYYLKGDFPKALDHLKIPLTLDPIPSEIAYHIGMILIANENPALAKDYLQRASEDESAPDYQQKAKLELDKMK